MSEICHYCVDPDKFGLLAAAEITRKRQRTAWDDPKEWGDLREREETVVIHLNKHPVVGYDGILCRCQNGI